MRYVIIGNSAAAIGGVEGIRQVDRNGEIILISDEPHHTYSRPLISYYLEGKVNQEKMEYRNRDFYENNGVEAKLGIKVKGIDEENKKVYLEDESSVTFDRLLIATGGKPFIPPMKGLEKEEIYQFMKLNDVKAIDAALKEDTRAVIIGAGLIGLKAAEALSKSGVQVTVVELSNRVLSSILDDEAASIMQRRLESKGIKLILNTTVEEILGQEKVSSVKLKNGEVLDCSMLIIAIGVIPNTDLAKDTKIALGRGIKVNEKMETSVDDIYAAGDVAEGYDTVYESQRVIPIWPNAYKQGETAGVNMAGGKKTYQGGFPMNSIGFFNLPMITAGIIKPEGDQFEILSKGSSEGSHYVKIVLRDDVIVGFIRMGEIDRAGILTGLIADKVNISEIKDVLLQDDFSYIHFPEKWRKEKMLGGTHR